MIRESIYAALFGLVSQGEGLAGTISWTSPVAGGPTALAYTSRRVKLWTDIPTQPALCQAEHDETIMAKTGQESKGILGASWLIYASTGDPLAVPAQTTNPILDAIFALFPSEPELTQTLGGLVHYARIEGRIQKIQGDLDGQTLLVVPIRMLVPT
jgi:hypothetical protein